MLTVKTVEFNSRLRKYYHITSKGLQRLNEFVEDWRELMLIYQFVTKEDGSND